MIIVLIWIVGAFATAPFLTFDSFVRMPGQESSWYGRFVSALLIWANMIVWPVYWINRYRNRGFPH